MIQDSTPNRQVFYDVSGLTTRMMQVDPSGTVTAVQPIYIAKLADASTILYLENGANWNSGGTYIGPAVSSTYEDQYYRDSSYYYRSYSDDDWTRLPRFSSAGGAGDVTKAYVDGSLALRDTSIAWLNTNKVSLTYVDGSLALRDTSIAWLNTNKANISFVTSYVDGSLSARDTSIAWLNINKLDGSGTTNELPYWVDSNTLSTLPVATYPSLTELSYVKGVTSGIQSQLSNKAPNESPIFDIGINISNNIFHKYVGSITFSAAANKAVNILLGNYGFTGSIEITVYGSYSGENGEGAIIKRFSVGNGLDNTIYTNTSEVVSVGSDIGSKVAIGEFQWNGGEEQYIIPISHLTSVANTYTVSMRMTGGYSAASVYSAASLSDEITLTSLSPNYVNFYGNVGIGTTSPSAKLHVDSGSYASSNYPLLIKNSNFTAFPHVNYDTVVLQQTDAPTFRIVENDSSKALSFCVDGGVATISSNEPLRFFIGGTWDAVAYSGSGGTKRFDINASGYAGRKVPRIQSIASSASITPDADLYDCVDVTALATNTTFNNPTGTLNNKQSLMIDIMPDATPRTLAFSSSSGGYISGGVTLPTTTVASKMMSMIFIYDSVVVKWKLRSLAQE